MTVNVLMFGTVRDGITDDTAAIQAAIDFASKTNDVVYIPWGKYAAAGLKIEPVNKGGVITGLVSLRGAGGRQSWLVRPPGVNGHMLTIGYIDNNAVDGVGFRASQARISGLCFFGAGGSSGHAIYCPPADTKPPHVGYGFAPYLDDVFIDASPEDGIHLATGRSHGYFSRVIVQYCNKHQLYAEQNGDHCLMQCSMGGSQLRGYPVAKFVSVYNNKVYGSDFFTAIGASTIKIEGGGSWINFTDCIISGGDHHGIEIEGSAADDKPISLTGCVFTDNSRAAHATYSDILLSSRANVSIIGCKFFTQGTGIAPVHHVQMVGTLRDVQYKGNVHLPGAVGISIANQPARLV